MSSFPSDSIQARANKADTMTKPQWSFGDKVVHAAKPEWGTGVITSASSATHEGQPCQRVTIRFERAGMKTLSTAVAELRCASEERLVSLATPPDSGTPNKATQPAEQGWLASIKPTNPAEQLLKLPDATTDPFSTLEARLKATIALFRFTDVGASLLDWAAAQTGLKDPLSLFSRHELEQVFRRFKFVREDQLKKLMGEARQKDPALLARITRESPAPVQQSMRRIDASR